MPASAESNKPQWISFKDPLEHIEATFPHQPTHMSFDIPLEKSEQLGKLVVYSAPFDNELLMLYTLSSPLFTGNELDERQFQDILYTHIIKRMFYQPKIFKNHTAYNQKPIQVHEYPGIAFSIAYQDHEEKHFLAGLACMKEKKLFILFYLAPEKDFKEQVLKEFIQSFHITD